MSRVQPNRPDCGFDLNIRIALATASPGKLVLALARGPLWLGLYHERSSQGGLYALISDHRRVHLSGVRRTYSSPLPATRVTTPTVITSSGRAALSVTLSSARLRTARSFGSCTRSDPKAFRSWRFEGRPMRLGGDSGRLRGLAEMTIARLQAQILHALR